MMTVRLICAQCMQDDVSKASIIAISEIRDEAGYEIQCPAGHRSLMILQQQKFEVLFDLGASALLDGYYREAVSSFTSSLERFYEFFVKACLAELKQHTDDIHTLWKMVSAQSERQLGAYIILYGREIGSKPDVLDVKETKFRNDVVHKGRIPSRAEALSYGQHVLDLIQPAITIAQQRFPKGVQWTIWEHIRIAHETAARSNLPTATSSMSTIVSLSHSDRPKTLEEGLSRLKMWRGLLPR